MYPSFKLKRPKIRLQYACGKLEENSRINVTFAIKVKVIEESDLNLQAEDDYPSRKEENRK